MYISRAQCVEIGQNLVFEKCVCVCVCVCVYVSVFV